LVGVAIHTSPLARCRRTARRAFLFALEAPSAAATAATTAAATTTAATTTTPSAGITTAGGAVVIEVGFIGFWLGNFTFAAATTAAANTGVVVFFFIVFLFAPHGKLLWHKPPGTLMTRKKNKEKGGRGKRKVGLDNKKK
jgi:hypothetical protein